MLEMRNNRGLIGCPSLDCEGPRALRLLFEESVESGIVDEVCRSPCGKPILRMGPLLDS